MSDDLPVKLEASAKVEASLKVTGEVPSDALGRLVHSLTDMVSPFAERQGLKGDLLRLQRADVALEIARRAKAITDLSEAVAAPVSPKILVSLLEKASLEDPDSDLIDWWARLLASTVSSVPVRHPIFADILSRMTADEARFLEELTSKAEEDVLSGAIDLDYIFKTVVGNPAQYYLDHRPKNDEVANFCNYTLHKLEQFSDVLGKRAILVKRVTFPACRASINRDWSRSFLGARSIDDVCDTLISIGLASRHYRDFATPTPFIGEFAVSLEYIALTSIGRTLMATCSPSRR